MQGTIFAPATAAGRAAVAVVRISGPKAGEAMAALAGPLPRPRQAAVRRLTHGGEAIDQAVVLWLPGPASYTGEDCAELQVHGGGAVLAALFQALTDLGLRLAEPGEFTRRAFAHGKLDLAQAEAVADLVDADTAAQRRQALRQLEGALGVRYGAWRDLIVDALAPLEAAVDFPDEDLPADVIARARPAIEALLGDVEAALADAGRGERVREGWRIAIVGQPNAGKSTLLNALAGREAAIVTATPGTTRDVIEVPLEWGGYKVLLGDTAGLRETDDAIEVEGGRRARAWAEQADLRLWIVDGSADDAGVESVTPLLVPTDICLVNKADLVAGAALAQAKSMGWEIRNISARSAADVATLQTVLTDRIVAAQAGDFPAATRGRHRAVLSQARDYLTAALGQTEVELAAEDLRLTARALDRITGRVDPEAILDRIFMSFCIGK